MEQIDRALDMLQALAGRLGQTVDQLWPHVVRYEALDALTNIVGIALPLTVCLYMITIHYRGELWIDPQYKDPTRRGAWGIASIVAALLFSLVISLNLHTVLEPVGAAATKILRQVR